MHWNVLAAAWYSNAMTWLEDALSIEVMTMMLLFVSTAASILAAYTAIQALRLEGRSRAADTEMRKTETGIEILMRMGQRFRSDPDFIALRREAGRMLLIGKYSMSLEKVLDFLESIAFYVRIGILDIEMAEHSYAGVIGMYWTISYEFVQKERDIYNRPEIWEELEQIFTLFQDRSEAKTGVRWGDGLTDEAKKAFLESEASLKVHSFSSTDV